MHKNLIENFMELIWDPTKNETFWYYENVVTSPHVKKSEID
jgi:hypothetical protein